MTDLEFSVLDELYFVTAFEELEKSVDLPRDELISVLNSLWEKGWLRCYLDVDNELDPGNADIGNQFHKYHYLASKEGLFAHNSR